LHLVGYLYYWQMGFNSVFKGLTLYLLTWRIWWVPNNASKGQMEFNLAFKGLKFISYLTVNTCLMYQRPTF